METLWDHNPTDEECRSLWLCDRAAMERFLVPAEHGEDDTLLAISELLDYRGDSIGALERRNRMSPMRCFFTRFDPADDFF